ncbi:BapA prefix-like domain-containing protein, partial [Rhodobacteraceae bacterium R_SAG2]|nr:BapA prefix-like domain-containing protein [Rhodobacteraceae bacterium R_SAG2]
MANRTIQAGSEIGINIDVNRSDIARYARQGDDLFITLTNGDVIT